VVLGIVTLSLIAVALVRTMVVRPISVATGLAAFFCLFQADAGIIAAFVGGVASAAIADVALAAARSSRFKAIAWPAHAAAWAASLSVIWQIGAFVLPRS